MILFIDEPAARPDSKVLVFAHNYARAYQLYRDANNINKYRSIGRCVLVTHANANHALQGLVLKEGDLVISEDYSDNPALSKAREELEMLLKIYNLRFSVQTGGRLVKNI